MKRVRGFTLAELLIVVAIMAVLVGIAIPVFSSVLERSREVTDTANIRSEYAHILTAVLNGEYDLTRDADAYTVHLVQAEDGWQSDAYKNLPLEIKDKVIPKANGYAVLTYDGEIVAKVSLDFSDGQ